MKEKNAPGAGSSQASDLAGSPAPGRGKPRITDADRQAYERVAALPNETVVKFGEQPATFLGMSGYLVTLRVKGRTVYLRAGDPRIATIQPLSPATSRSLSE